MNTQVNQNQFQSCMGGASATCCSTIEKWVGAQGTYPNCFCDNHFWDAAVGRLGPYSGLFSNIMRQCVARGSNLQWPTRPGSQCGNPNCPLVNEPATSRA